MFNFARQSHIAEKIVFIDGISGSGKSIISPIIASFKNVEKMRIEHIYEYLCILHDLNKLDTDAGVSLMRIHADLALYNSMISREINLRIPDESGLIKNNSNPFKYIARLFYKDGDIVLERIKKESPIIQLMTHQILPVSDLAFKAYGERLKIIEMVRHPLYMIEHWFSYIERYGSDDPREFTLNLDHNGLIVPWFAHEWSGKFKNLKPMDRCIHAIDWLIQKGIQKYEKLDEEQKKQILFIPFEKFVLEPWPFMKELEIFLGTNMTHYSKKALSKQKCPRKLLTQGRGYKRYGWEKPEKGITERYEWNKRMEFVKKNASDEYIEVLEKLCYQYEKRYSFTINTSK